MCACKEGMLLMRMGRKERCEVCTMQFTARYHGQYITTLHALADAPNSTGAWRSVRVLLLTV